MLQNKADMRIPFGVVSIFTLVVSVLLPFSSVFAAEVAVTPVVIDEKAKARDILKQSLTITNTSERKLNLYPSVSDIHAREGEQDFVSAQDSGDRMASLANWIELSRGVIELGPGESKEIPFVIRVNLNASAGSYHARIAFSEGSSRAGSDEGIAAVMVNLEVQADIKELLQLNKFSTDNVYFSGDDVLFNYQLENIGNQALQPKGEIRIYNRKGEEVASLAVNTESKAVTPDEIAQLASVWDAVEGFGKYKAFLNVDYGTAQTASIQDTVYFWIIPWKQLIGLFVGSSMIVIFFALYFHRILEARHMRFATVMNGVHHVAPVPTPQVVLAPTAPVSKPKRSPFAFFSRIVRRKPKAASVEPVGAPVIHEKTPQPEMPVVSAPPVATVSSHVPPQMVVHEHVGHGVTIDLKKMRQPTPTPTPPTTSVHSPESSSHGHVINLKRK